MQIIADTHTHTLASTHAFSTILENARAASQAGLAYLGWTDHGSSMTDAPHIWHFGNMRVVPDELCGVKLLKGAEANLCDMEGHLDLPDSMLEKLGWVVASIHDPVLPPDTAEDYTAAYIGAARNPYVDVIGHSGLTRHPYDYEAGVKAFRDAGKLVEINEGTFLSRPASLENCLKIASCCKAYECRVIVNSDAHFAAQIGRMPKALAMLAEIGFPPELIVNTSLDRFEAYLEERRVRVSRSAV